MRILVTGATGFVGRHVVPALLEHGHTVRALVRDLPAASLPAGVEAVPGDVTDAASVRAAADGVDACIHLVAIIDERGAQTFARVNVEGTANVVRAVRDAGVRRLIHQSALGAAPDPRFPYLRSKWLGEEAVRGSDLDYTILRPSVIFGEGAGFFRPIVWTLRWMPVYPLPRGGRTKFQPVAVGDVARAMLASLDGAASRATIDLGGPRTMTFREIAETAAAALGKRVRMIGVPLWTARPFAFVQRMRAHPLVTNRQLDMVVLDNVCDPALVERTFGFTPVAMEATDLRWLAEL